MGVRPYLWMLLGAASFATMGALAHALRRDVSWPAIALARSLVPLVLTAVAARAASVPLVFWRPGSLWMRSLAGSVSLVCAFFALTHLPIAVALTLTNLYPLWVALLSWPLLGAAPGVDAWLATGIGIAGVALIQRPYLAESHLAMLAALTSSLGAAVAMIGLHRLRQVDVRAIVFHFSAVSSVFCLAALLGVRQDLAASAVPNAADLAMLVGTGLAATLGQICITLAFASGAPARVSVVGLTQIGFGLIFDVLIWGREFDALSLAGMALVVAPTAWLLLRRPVPLQAPAD